jgi:hypothetical protein
MVSSKDEFDALTDDPVSYILDYKKLIALAVIIISILIVTKWYYSTNT